jgi:predicted alpha/beta hydrolase family esterase
MSKKSKVPLALEVIQWLFPKIESLSLWLANKWFQKLFFTPFRYNAPEKEVDAAQQAEKYQRRVGAKTIQVYAWGAGPAVLVVHGWAGRGTQFRKFIEPFNQAGLRLVAIDGPAHGRSSGSKTDLKEFSEVIREVYTHEKCIAIIAHSFGGVASLFAISESLNNNVQINIASPTIAEEIIKSFLKALNASPTIGTAFREYVIRQSGHPFEYFSALEIIKRVPDNLHLLLVHDVDDAEVSIEHPRELQKRFPQAMIFETKKLGHNRILKEEAVINRCVTFILQKASMA